MAGANQRRGGAEGQTFLVLGERSEQSSWELSITSVHASRFGDHVIIGRDGTEQLRRALVPSKRSPRDPVAGETWRVTGPVKLHPEYGPQLHAEVALPLVTKGRAIIRHLATDKRFVGIGWATAEKVWERFGETIYSIIRDRDLKAVADVVGADRAIAIVDGFGMLAEEVEIFRWLDRYGVSPRVAGAAARLWGLGAIDRIKADPFTMTLLEPWKDVDARALRLGVALDDPRRLTAAVEEALAIRFRTGNMASPSPVLKPLVKRLLAPWSGDPASAIDLALASSRVVSPTPDLLQSRACRFMEEEVARQVSERVGREVPAFDGKLVVDAIAKVEEEIGYALTDAQREAVYMATSCGICVISGGAGTGKTTVVRAILAALEAVRDSLPASQRQGVEHLQVALAGRAVRRISEATGRPASTLSRLVHDIENAGRRVQSGTVIFDESSMLDTPSIYRVLAQLPIEVNLIFIGDPGQLPPIGPGLPFHTMVKATRIPSVTLDVVHRQDDATGIPAVASAVRSGKSVALRRFDPNVALSPGVYLFPATKEDVAARTLAAFRAMCGRVPAYGRTAALHDMDVQILTQVKNGPAGSKELNRAIEIEYMARQANVEDWGLSVGSKIMWLKNDYSKAPQLDADGSPLLDKVTGEPVCSGFMNGSLGVVTKPHPKGAWVRFDDGAEDAVTAADLEKVTHGWAISVHKAQGSAFRRVIVPLVGSKLLDRTLLYTAVTRAVETVVIVGDPEVLRRTIEEPPTALDRSSSMSLEAEQ
ncbi:MULTISPECIES: AAA family ATPase [unclassified Agrobacterium]|uniref:AAA family ATPase n=1 Tax=unclassified Agrobacterium TaxID=2632611 RepID=UPI00244690E9|nr:MULTISPECIES: AAA family ATPase [unclassified Agrobacterium]MDH0614136.1 ATP-dependent RecD-like DNA helicase [Agrobacterium sp. GD03872]MDH0695569.1 ATP-dependent RecD-like DNA helicase [Agrobacterium sp. GD03871]MDH1058471.1 ATP-dependent RecD-like DNA helicase [Agrobacterium sp. GD03992]MDH2209587.1 ATP-dependent RecD-like DNA helicase [Agrobacterium sp. GD03643]MDH2218991.1 ATP-dependent RecD-like DNA helicase [Agrobacterium sp. GD03638]